MTAVALLSVGELLLHLFVLFRLPLSLLFGGCSSTLATASILAALYDLDLIYLAGTRVHGFELG